MLPRFLILGAAKAGTTWLGRSLNRHPDIFLPAVELHYFSRHFERPTEWYEGHFSNARAPMLLGERSNTYLYDKRTPSRVLDTLDDPKLIVLLRDPVDRAYSDYCMHFARDSELGALEEVLDPTGYHAQNLFLEQGRYATLIERYRTRFSPSRIEVVLYDDLVATPQQVLRKMTHFLGADPRRLPAKVLGRANQRRSSRRPPWIRAIDRSLGRRTHTLFRAGTPKLLCQISRLGSKPIEYPALRTELRERLVEFYEPEVAAIESLLGRNLNSWRVAR